jgi:hypothetical protein
LLALGDGRVGVYSAAAPGRELLRAHELGELVADQQAR